MCRCLDSDDSGLKKKRKKKAATAPTATSASTADVIWCFMRQQQIGRGVLNTNNKSDVFFTYQQQT